MGKTVECPFCGQKAEKSKEHIWAQWLHRTEGAKVLLAGSNGERIPIEHVYLSRSPDGRLQREKRVVGRMARDLPNLTVLVCDRCNSGWMGTLERHAGDILKPLILGERKFLKLTEIQLRQLATWAMKSWMAYALLKSPIENPFTVAEYRAMVTHPTPLPGCSIWLLCSAESHAYVGMNVWSTLLEWNGGEASDFETVQNNTAFAYVALEGCVLYLVRTPIGLPPHLWNLLVPESLRSFGARQIWPSPRPQYFPIEVMPDSAYVRLLAHAQGIRDLLELPAAGLTDAQRGAVYEKYVSGEGPEELRREYGPRE